MKHLSRSFWILIVWLAGIGAAASEITLSPLRQVITADAPTAEYHISNPSDRIIEGRISWIDLQVTETGYRYAASEVRDALSAAPYLRVRPANFRLEPGGRAKIIVELRNRRAIPDGERRSHLLVETAAARTQLRKAGGGLELDIGLGVSTPVILRGGAINVDAVFHQTRLLRDEDGFLELETTIASNGAHSAFGRLTAIMTGQSRRKNGGWKISQSTKGAKPAPLAKLENVAVYPGGPPRRFVVPLDVEQLPAGVLELQFSGAAEYAGRIFATKSFEIVAPE